MIESGAPSSCESYVTDSLAICPVKPCPAAVSPASMDVTDEVVMIPEERRASVSHSLVMSSGV